MLWGFRKFPDISTFPHPFIRYKAIGAVPMAWPSNVWTPGPGLTAHLSMHYALSVPLFIRNHFALNAEGIGGTFRGWLGFWPCSFCRCLGKSNGNIEFWKQGKHLDLSSFRSSAGGGIDISPPAKISLRFQGLTSCILYKDSSLTFCPPALCSKLNEFLTVRCACCDFNALLF